MYTKWENEKRPGAKNQSDLNLRKSDEELSGCRIEIRCNQCIEDSKYS